MAQGQWISCKKAPETLNHGITLLHAWNWDSLQINNIYIEKSIHSSKIVLKFVKFFFEVLVLGMCLTFGGVLWGRDLTSVPNGYQLVPVCLLSPFTYLETTLQIQRIKGFRSLVIWEAHKRQVSFSESSPRIWPLPVSGIHKCPRRFCVVNHACFCEDRGCEHGAGAESTVTTDHAEQLHH